MAVNTVADLWDTYFFDKLFQALQAIGKQPSIVHTQAAPDLRSVLREGASCQVDGVLVFADNVTAAMAKSAFATPAIGMMNRLDRPTDRVGAVRLDQRTDLERIVEALVKSGCRRVSYVSGRRTASFEDERFLAVRDALGRHGLAPFGPATGGAFSYEFRRAGGQHLAAARIASSGRHPVRLRCHGVRRFRCGALAWAPGSRGPFRCRLRRHPPRLGPATT